METGFKCLDGPARLNMHRAFCFYFCFLFSQCDKLVHSIYHALLLSCTLLTHTHRHTHTHTHRALVLMWTKVGKETSSILFDAVIFIISHLCFHKPSCDQSLKQGESSLPDM